MVKRLEKYKKNIIINISNNNPSKIIKFCKDNELNYFVGSDHNVLKDIMTVQHIINQKTL